jgi:membrane protein YdbS with pleckstrin-like domain
MGFEWYAGSLDGGPTGGFYRILKIRAQVMNEAWRAIAHGLDFHSKSFPHPIMAIPFNPADTATESPLWKGHTSQWVHFWYYFFCLLLAAAATAGAVVTGGLAAIGLIVPLLMWIVRWLVTKSTSYELTTQRLKISTGIFNKHLDELELFRVKDYSMTRPFFLRMMGLGHLTLVTSDISSPTVNIKAIPRVEEVREMLRAAVQTERDRKRVRELDMGGEGGDALVG